MLTSLSKVTGVAFMEHSIAGTLGLNKQDSARGRKCSSAFRAVALKSERDKLVQATSELGLNDLLVKLNYRLVGRMEALFIEAGADVPSAVKSAGALLVNSVDNISAKLTQVDARYRCHRSADCLLLRCGCLFATFSHCTVSLIAQSLSLHNLSQCTVSLIVEWCGSGVLETQLSTAEIDKLPTSKAESAKKKRKKTHVATH